MTIDEINLLNKKSETKKDGVYSFRGNLWVVKSNKFFAFVTTYGEVFQRTGCFNVKIGDLSILGKWDWKKAIIEQLLKK